MSKISRRQFVKTTTAMVMVPLVEPSSQIAGSDELSVNCSPSRQVLPIEVAVVLSKVTGFDFTPRNVSEAEGRRFAHVLRRAFGRIQDEATSKAVTIRSDHLGWLEAFVRSGPFRIQRTAQFVSLTVEV